MEALTARIENLRTVDPSLTIKQVGLLLEDENPDQGQEIRKVYRRVSKAMAKETQIKLEQESSIELKVKSDRKVEDSLIKEAERRKQVELDEENRPPRERALKKLTDNRKVKNIVPDLYPGPPPFGDGDLSKLPKEFKKFDYLFDNFLRQRQSDMRWKYLAELMGSGAQFELKPNFTIPIDIPRECENCGDKCIYECICGENYCSKKCQYADWGTHQQTCDSVRENALIATKGVEFYWQAEFQRNLSLKITR